MKKCDDRKVLSYAYMMTDALTRKEQLKLILLLISWYYSERN